MISKELIPLGRSSQWKELRAAGVSSARSLRNVPWIAIADDGWTVLKLWRNYIDADGSYIVARLDTATWSELGGGAPRKSADVIDGLRRVAGSQIRVIVIEERREGSRQSKGARLDNQPWWVEDTGEDFVLWRGLTMEQVPVPEAPASPEGFGALNPTRRAGVSTAIERLPAVRDFTLRRARNHCEIPDCSDYGDFDGSLDVHHITSLGAGGADHTDNTVCLCPPCHARVHRGTDDVRRRLEQQLRQIRETRLASARNRYQSIDVRGFER